MITYLWYVLFIFVLILVNGFFAMVELAVISARKSALQQREADGSKGASAALKLKDDPTRLLATTQVIMTLIGVFAAALTAFTFEYPLTSWILSLGIGFLTPVASFVSIFLVTIIMSYFTLVIGELIPKQLGLQRADSIASHTALVVIFVSTLMGPVVKLLSASTDLLGKLIGIRKDVTAAQVSEEEIKLIVDEQQHLSDEEKSMISEIFELSDTVVREVMVPRVDIVFAQGSETVGEAAKRLYARGFSRVPVYEEDYDRIIGILILKDLVMPLADGEYDQPITDYLREPVFVPETKDLMSTLTEMQESRIQIVIVVDEYGGTAGLVSMEDILEEVTGEIIDETDQEMESIVQTDDSTWLVNGTCDIEDAIEEGLPLEVSDEYETIAGWLLEQLGHIPHVGEYVEYEGYRFTVITMRRRRIARMRVVKLKAPEPLDPENVA
ncbi:MAG: hemolysin family protein [Coriobacteriia bacterium]|nr:hemolysin family protein [Coriobacteriia bacterium]MCL2536796.1 hemolysin family protein [Coriobacteriia bacterium]